jgi:hypothetical protein
MASNDVIFNERLTEMLCNADVIGYFDILYRYLPGKAEE